MENWSNAGGENSEAWAIALGSLFGLANTVVQTESDKKVAQTQSQQDRDTNINIYNNPTATSTSSLTQTQGNSKMVWLIAGGAILVVGTLAVILATKNRK